MKIRSYRALLCGTILIGVIFALSLMSLPVIAGEVSDSKESISQPIKYPPYPDVWGYEFPMSALRRGSQIEAYNVSDGDFAITYLIDLGKSTPEWRLEGVNFFSGRKIEDNDIKKYEKYRSIYGKTVKQDYIRINAEISWKRGQACFSCCPDYSNFPITKYSPYSTNEQLNVIYFSDEPISIYYVKPFDKCIGKGAWQQFESQFYYRQVFTVLPFFIPLKDGTFLLYDSLGNFIIRLDKNFNSKSDLLNRKVFIVKTTDIRSIETKLFETDIFNRQTYDKAVTVFIKALKQGIHREAALKEALDSIRKIEEGKNNGN